MKATLVTLWATVRESYWFVPSIMAFAAIVLSLAATSLDAAIGSKWIDDIGWLYANRPAGARAVLSTVAGSMITVAGVTFSMTILSISHTTGLVGPRLLNNLMRDKGNQITLGVFISTFLYCLMVLRTVRSAETSPQTAGSNVQSVDAFVPHFAILVGLMAAISSVGVLIYFIHHVAESIHVSNIVAGVGRELESRIEEQFPSLVGSPNEDEDKRRNSASMPEGFFDDAVQLTSVCSGYIEYVDASGLLNIAAEHDFVVRLRHRAGDFVTPNSVLLLASPSDAVTDEISTSMQSCFVRGSQRTAVQDLRFVINQLVEVAARALSPGVNDPFTAMNCMDWLRAGLEKLASRKLPDAHRYDDKQQLRLVAEPDSLEAFASLVFDQLTPYFASDSNGAIHMMETLSQLVLKTESISRQRVLVRHGERLRKEYNRINKDLQGCGVLTNRYRAMVQLHRSPAYRLSVVRTGDWVGSRG
ncbi:MAG: DUF2254 domain-containing protein [Fuerstiella sp.]